MKRKRLVLLILALLVATLVWCFWVHNQHEVINEAIRHERGIAQGRTPHDEAAEQTENGVTVDQRPLGILTNGYSDQLKQAAEQGNMIAQEALAEAYARGHGCEHDVQEALKWYRKAAEQGLAEAQCNLGMDGIFGDKTEGTEWIRKAAQHGSAPAQTQLGVYYYRGVGVPKNTAEGAKWLLKAAEQGYAEGQSQLGLSYFSGDGVPADYVEAYKWISLAEAQGFTRGDVPLSRLQRIMTREQIGEGQRLARQFRSACGTSAVGRSLRR
jgi:TPR repeat protein